MRIVVIVGVVDSGILNRELWRRLDEVFEVEFPGVPVIVERSWYLPWDFQKMRKYGDRIVEKYDTGEDVILMGYSMGGVVASSIAARFTKSNVRMLATVFSPHQFLWGWFSSALGSNQNGFENFPVVSFTAKYDWIVWWGSAYPAAIKHFPLECDHYFLWLYFSMEPLQRIAREMRKHL